MPGKWQNNHNKNHKNWNNTQFVPAPQVPFQQPTIVGQPLWTAPTWQNTFNPFKRAFTPNPQATQPNQFGQIPECEVEGTLREMASAYREKQTQNEFKSVSASIRKHVLKGLGIKSKGTKDDSKFSMIKSAFGALRATLADS